MTPLLLLLAQAPDPATMLAVAKEAVAGERCRYDSQSTDITVCGLRHADRYRVPLQVERPRGTMLADSASTERASLTHRATPLEQLSPFLVEGGHVGVSVGVAFGPGADAGRTRIAGPRRLAP